MRHHLGKPHSMHTIPCQAQRCIARTRIGNSTKTRWSLGHRWSVSCNRCQMRCQRTAYIPMPDANYRHTNDTLHPHMCAHTHRPCMGCQQSNHIALSHLTLSSNFHDFRIDPSLSPLCILNTMAHSVPLSNLYTLQPRRHLYRMCTFQSQVFPSHILQDHNHISKRTTGQTSHTNTRCTPKRDQGCYYNGTYHHQQDHHCMFQQMVLHIVGLQLHQGKRFDKRCPTIPHIIVKLKSTKTLKSVLFYLPVIALATIGGNVIVLETRARPRST
jgi:hypothetical protein